MGIVMSVQSNPFSLGWTELSDTALRGKTYNYPNVTSGIVNRPPSYQYNFNDAAFNITAAWCGGCWDSKRNRLLIMGGGHNSYFGNDVFGLTVAAVGSMARIFNPSLYLRTDYDEIALSDGTISSRHTWNKIAYCPDQDFMVAMGGSSPVSGVISSDIWTCDMSTASMNPTDRWVLRYRAAVDYTVFNANNTVYHPVHKLVYFMYGGAGGSNCRFSYWDPANPGSGNTTQCWTQLRQTDQTWGVNTTVIDPVRDLYIGIGSNAVKAIDINTSPWTVVDHTPGSPPTILSSTYPGVAYDPVLDKVVCWDGGDTVYYLNTSDWSWTSENIFTLHGTHGPAALANGTFGRFRYDAAHGAFAYYGDVDANGFVLRVR